jgi:hypothetical protein
MGYWIALVIGVLLILMALGGTLCMAMDIGPAGGPGDVAASDRDPFRAIIPFAIGAVLIVIGIMGLRRRKRSEHLVDDTDLDVD